MVVTPCYHGQPRRCYCRVVVAIGTPRPLVAFTIPRASSTPTREKVLKTLNSMGEFNLGDVVVNYSPAARKGWGRIDLTMIGETGRLVR